MTTRHDPTLWSWIAPDGTEGTGDGGVLRARLASGDLAPATLVWRRGWTEWLAARDVRELGIGGGTEPVTSPHAVAPPPRPRALPKLPVTDKGGAPSSFGTIGRPRGPSVLGPPRGDPTLTEASGRLPLPTLGDQPPQTRGTLRPPRAVPPPPRGLGRPLFEASPPRVPVDEAPPTRKQDPVPISRADTEPQVAPIASAPPTELRSAVVVPSKLVDSRTRGPRPASAPESSAAELDETPGSTPFEVTAQDFIDLEPPSTTLESTTAVPPGALPEPHRTARTLPPRRTSPKRTWLSIALLTAVGVAGVISFVVLKSGGGGARESEPTTDPVESAAPAPSGSSEPAPPEGCEPVQPAARLVPGVDRSVMPLFGEHDERRVRAGIATITGRALGLYLDTQDLDVEQAFSEEGEQPLVAVVPLDGDAPSFAVDREDEQGRRLRTIAGPKRFALGVRGDDWIAVRDGKTQVLWAGAATGRTTDARVASRAGAHLVTFRSGGLNGNVRYAWLDADGVAKGPPEPLEPEGVTLVGTPDVALSDGTGLVSFAGRGQASEPWRVQLARVLPGGAPSLRTFATPPGGEGGENIAPSVAGLGHGFVLQWTEGASGQYQVRVQRLSTELEPVGEPVLVSSKGANAGQGAIYAHGARVISVFIQTTAGHDELWGASLECR